MLLLFLILLSLFFLQSNNLLLTLILLELIGFILLFFVSVYLSPAATSDFLVLSFFSIFVIEGVIALSGLIILVTFTGSDYVSSSSLLNF